MSLPIPVVGVDSGPDYALNIDACLAILDSHNHSSGQGVQITPNGLNINADLPLGNNNLTSARSLRFMPQGSAISLPADLGCLYEAGVDLYFNDGNGNQIRITQSGNVSGASGTITGLPSGTASASYSAGTFTFQSATNTSAVLDFQSAILRNNTASSFGITLSAPTLSSNYNLVLPVIPAQTNVLTLDVSGNISSTTWNAVAQNRTRATGTTVGLGGIAISASCGSFSTASATPVSITNLSVTLTTSGRPVWVGLKSDGNNGGNYGQMGARCSGSGDINVSASFDIIRSAVSRGGCFVNIQAGASSAVQNIVPADFSTIDVVGAGTYTWTVTASVAHSGGTGGTQLALCQFAELIAYEL